MDNVVKTIQIRQCRRCAATWAGEDISLSLQDQIVFVTITIAHCPACSEGFAAEINRPTYRRTGKKLR